MTKRSIYALHEGPWDWMMDVEGWAVITVHAWQVEEVRNETSHVPIVRLNNGYGSDGTIPWMAEYNRFAERLGLIAGNSPDVHHWIIGNEPNHEQEWPGGMKIYPEEYGRCYVKCREAIKARPGHERDQVLVAAIAPWTAKVTYAGNERGDWVQYLADVIASIGDADGYALHSYTHGHAVGHVTSGDSMDPPFQDRHYHFRAYRDFMSVIPRGAPVYITECCPVDTGWLNMNIGYVQALYREIDEWNQHTGTPVRCLALYRGIEADRWYFADKGQVRQDWDQALAQNYTVDIDEGEDEMPEEQWMQVYLHAMERGFYDQGGKPEFTVPKGMQLYYLHNADVDTEFNEPETDQKDAETQSEVYEGRYAAVIMFQFSTGAAWLVGDPVYVQNGRPVRADAHYMHVFQNAGGGSRLGLVDGDGPFLQQHAFPPEQREAVASHVTWGGWRDTYHGIPQRQWVELTSPQLMPTQGYVRPVLEFASNDAGFAAGHFDALRIEQLLGEEPEPSPDPDAEIDYERIRAIVREELDKTKLVGR